MKRSLALAVCLVSAVASASPGGGSPSAGTSQPAPGPPGPTVPQPGSNDLCKVGGAPLLVLNHRVPGAVQAVRPKIATWTVTVYTNGSWNRVDVTAAGALSKRSGCMPAATVTKLRGDSASAKWKTTPAQAACAAVSETVNELVVAAKTLWTEEMCPSKVLDKASAGAYADIMATMTAQAR